MFGLCREEKKVTFPQSFILFSFKPHHVRPETEFMRGKWGFSSLCMYDGGGTLDYFLYMAYMYL